MNDLIFEHTFRNGKKAKLFVHRSEEEFSIKGEHDIDKFAEVVDEWLDFGAQTARTLRTMCPGKSEQRLVTKETAEVFAKILAASLLTES